MALKLFYSYSTKDEELRDQLETHLSMLRRQGIIEEWHFRKIVAGRNFDDDIDKNLDAADIILLLVSADFLDSEYCWNREVKRALERQSLGDVRVIPIIVRPCDWSGAPFANLEALPRDAKAVTSWSNRDEAWTDVAKGLRASFNEVINQAPKSTRKEDHTSESDTSVSDVAAATDSMEIFLNAQVSPGSSVMLGTCIALEDPSGVRASIARLRDDFLHDSYIRSIISSFEELRRQGQNYRTDDPEIRSRITDRVATLLFEGYACFADRSFFGSLDDGRIREILFGRLLYERLRAYRYKRILINVSEDSASSIEDTQELVQALLRDIHEREGILLDHSPAIARVMPGDACTTIGSYVSAITLKKLESPDSSGARAFEKIRNKMRLIHDLATDTFYSRDRQLP
jgi:hypothetical protein